MLGYLIKAGTVAGAVVAIVTMWTLLELPTGWVLAHRGYVDAIHIKDVAARDEIIISVIELARDQRDRLSRSRDVLITRMTAATDPQVRTDLQLLVTQANQDVTDVETRITALERIRK